MATELCIHSGAKMVARQAVYDVPTHGWGPNQCPVPVPHGYMIDKTLEWITSDDLVLLEERHALGHHGANYFGVFTVQRPGVESDHGLADGIRNSHDRTYSAGLAVRSKVFICDNLAFSAEIVVQRKHTKNVIRDLTRLLA